MNRCNSGTDSKVWMRKGKRIFTAETPEVLAVFVYKEGDLMDDIKYMRRALELANMAEGDTSPNPMVGAVITDSSGKIVGEGYHHKAGQPHAEINALAAAGDKAKGATVYVTLEPCQMCAGAIVQARIPRVVIGSMNPKAGCAGSVLNLLEMDGFNHKVEVIRGVLQEECSIMLSDFFRELREKKKMLKKSLAEQVGKSEN